MEPRFSIVVAGHLCLDVIPDLSLIPEKKFMEAMQPGRLVVAGAATFSTGGAVSNTGLALHRLGVPVHLIAKVGVDYFGDVVRAVVRSQGEGLDKTLISDPISATSYTFILNPPGVDRMFIHCPGTNDELGYEDIEYDLLRNAGILHFGYPPLMRKMYINEGKELVEIFRRAKLTGITTSLDLAFPNPTSEAGRSDWKKILSAVFPYVDIFVPSFEELLFLFYREKYADYVKKAPGGDVLKLAEPNLLEDLGDELIQLGISLVMIKLGDQGIYLHSAGSAALKNMGRAAPSDRKAWENRRLWAPCFKVQVAGTTGSGDATIAGFLSALSRDMDPVGAATAAVAVGACNVEAPDALGGLRTWPDTMRRIDGHWERLLLQLTATGWFLDERVGIWEKRRNVQ